MVIKYRQFSSNIVPPMLLEREIEAPFYILPDVRANFEGKKKEAECRTIAYQLVAFLQLAFYRHEAFLKYTGIVW